MQIAKRIVSVALIVMMVASCFSFISVSAGAVDDYYQSLINAGFPASYATRLTKLHLIHPSWEFVPLDITALSVQQGKTSYTWDYVITMEYSGCGEDNNLVYPSDSYIPYRKNSTKYDSGWWPVSKTALQFMMDPRNFMNERNMFMFMDLYYGDSTYSEADVEAALAGCFMANKVIPDAGNTLTYAQFFIQEGKKYNVNPIFIAARLRQEQGSGTSPLISGSCGSTLWGYYSNGTNGANGSHSYSEFMAMNGYYNYFNMGASGNGYFNIYYNGMTEAMNAGWNTHCKAISGGIQKLKSSYLDRYQNTLYFQKYNVDARSMKNGSCINFWGQYMQNFSAPYSEGRTIQKGMQAFLDVKVRFCIPVYSGMPSSPVSDPGSLFSGENYSYATAIDNPATASGATSSPSEVSYTINTDSNPTMYMNGWAMTTKGVTDYYYSIDYDNNWRSLTGYTRSDVYQHGVNMGYNISSSDINSYEGTVDLSGLSAGSHVIVIKGRTKSLSSATGVQNFPVAVINLTIQTEQSDCRYILDAPALSSGKPTVEIGKDMQLKGWALAPSGVSSFTVSIDGGAKVNLTAEHRDDVLAVPGHESYVDANYDLHAFNHYLPVDIAPGTHNAKIYVSAKSGLSFVMSEFDFEVVLGSDYSITATDASGYKDKTFNNQNVFCGIEEGTTANEVLAQLVDVTCVICDESGNVITNSKLSSGYTIKMMIGSTVVKSATVIVKGDIDGDGIVSAKDVLRTKKYLAGQTLNGYAAAADSDLSGTINITDLENIASICAK